MIYLEEQNRIEESLGSNSFTVEKPDIATNSIDSSGKFSIVANSDLAGASFINDLGKKLSANGDVIDPFEGTNYRILNEI